LKKENHKKLRLICLCLLSVLILVLLKPNYPFDVPYSLVVADSSGVLLGAHIAKDGQWRFQQSDSVPYKFEKCIVEYEDKRFYYHSGVDILSLIRALYDDIKYRKIVSGGSTLTMQTIRLSRNKDRTFVEKFKEVFLALRLELWYSKSEILKMYSSHAPFGGNTVGLETASQRYFGRPAYTLSWAEAAMLAVLPNNPSLIHLSRNRDKLLLKRNALLDKLLKDKIIDSLTCELSKEEIIPQKPQPYPEIAPHLLSRILLDKKRKSDYVRTTLDSKLQIQVNNILNRHIKQLRNYGINNGAVLVLDFRTSNVVAYVGNSQCFENHDDANDVDIITSCRSTGSVLKPFLYCAMLSEGELLPKTLVADLPMQISGYMPKNYRLTYDGAVSADKALARSLNVPAVKMLQQYGGEKFINVLQKMKITSINKPADYYGLSLILGGCEASLWQLCGAYASMARTLYDYVWCQNSYFENNFFQPNFYYGKTINKGEKQHFNFLSAGSIYLTFQALTQVEKPQEEQSQEMFSSSRTIAWKTGTSFGFRDAWAIGVTGNYVVGVWTGNADGEGRPDLIGIKASAPILFDVIKVLPQDNRTFPIPYNSLSELKVCRKSGYLAGENCEDIVEEFVPLNGENTKCCPYCRVVHLDKSLNFRVSADYEGRENVVEKKWFVLPPAMEYYYKKHNPDYKELPPLKNGVAIDLPFQIIYPEQGAKIFLPKGFDGNVQPMVLQAACRISNKKLFWHLDGDFVQVTAIDHKIAIVPKKGLHTILIMDEDGNSLRRSFEIIER